MKIEVKHLCSKCDTPLDMSDFTTTDADGHPAVDYYLEPCVHCMSASVTKFKISGYHERLDQLPGHRALSTANASDQPCLREKQFDES